MGSKKFLLCTVKLSEKLPFRSILKTCMGAMQTLLRTWSGRVPLSHEKFCNIYQRAVCISCFKNFIAFGHALFQADSGVWGVFLQLRFPPHSWLFLVCYANSSKYVAETETHYCLLSMPYCTSIGFVAWRKAVRTSFYDDLEVESSRNKKKHQDFF